MRQTESGTSTSLLDVADQEIAENETVRLKQFRQFAERAAQWLAWLAGPAAASANP